MKAVTISRVYGHIGARVGLGLTLAALAPRLARADSWNAVASMPTPRAYMGSAAPVLGSTVYLIGGMSGTSYLAVNEVYDATANVWWSRSPMRTARSGLVAGSPQGTTIYAVGGDGVAGSLGLALNEA